MTKTPPGSTPLEDTTGLIPKHVSSKTELDELEFANMNQAAQKYFLGKWSNKKAPFDSSWLCLVHREMYGKVWRWAGQIRTTELNIGASPHHIQEQLKQLVDNFWYWERETSMQVLEKATRLHHGLVKIHPFKNGNGRWARFITNIYFRKKGEALLQWPEETLQIDSPFRKNYISALQQADRGNYHDLIELHRKLSD